MVLLSTWMESQVEFWRKTQYDGYDVSNFGRVRSWWKIVSNKGWSCGAHAELAAVPKILRGAKDDGNGYAYINVRKSRSCPKVHKLVAEAFLPEIAGTVEINHVTGQKSNNHADNLERTTRLGNIQHAWRIGLRDNITPKGESHYGSKISDARIVEMQRLYDAGTRPVELAPMFGVTLANTYDLAKGVRGRGKTIREKTQCLVS
jgi:hypothetical protein